MLAHAFMASALFLVGQPAERADPHVAQTIQKLAELTSSWSSVEIEVRHELTEYFRKDAGGTPPRSTLREKYIETSRGQRMLELINPDPGGGERVFASFADGKTCYDVTLTGGVGTAQKQYVIKRDFSDEGQSSRSAKPLPWNYLFLEQQPLFEKLDPSRWQGAQEKMDRTCDVFLVKKARYFKTEVDMVYAIDRETGAPLEVRCYNTEKDRGEDRPAWTWEAVTLDEVDGYHVSLKSRELMFAASPKDDSDSERYFLTRDLVIEKIQFNKTYEDAVFHPEIAPGASVWDQISKKQWVEAKLPEGPAAAAERSAALEGRLGPPVTWAEYLLSLGLGVGGTILALGLFLRLRGRAG